MKSVLAIFLIASLTHRQNFVNCLKNEKQLKNYCYRQGTDVDEQHIYT